MLPSAAELNYFLEITQTLNLSRAAERLGISQPSLSLAVKRLEQTIGAVLFIRHKYGVSLTPAGKQLMVHVRELLQQWEHTKAKALASSDEIQGHFTLGCNSIIAIYLLSKVLPDLLEKYSRLDIHLKHGLSQEITEQVNNLSIDIGVVINPFKHPELVIQKIGEDETGFWVGEGVRDIQTIGSKKAVVLCNPLSIQAQSLLTKSKQIGVVFHRMVPTESMELIAKLTLEGCGIGILPKRVATSISREGRLQHLPQLPSYSDELCVIYRHENKKIQAIQAVVRAIIAQAK